MIFGYFLFPLVFYGLHMPIQCMCASGPSRRIPSGASPLGWGGPSVSYWTFSDEDDKGEKWSSVKVFFGFFLAWAPWPHKQKALALNQGAPSVWAKFACSPRVFVGFPQAAPVSFHTPKIYAGQVNWHKGEINFEGFSFCQNDRRASRLTSPIYDGFLIVTKPVQSVQN